MTTGESRLPAEHSLRLDDQRASPLAVRYASAPGHRQGLQPIAEHDPVMQGLVPKPVDPQSELDYGAAPRLFVSLFA